MDAWLALYLGELEARRASASVKGAQGLLPRFFDHLREAGIQDLRAAREEHLVSFLAMLGRYPSRRGRKLSPWTLYAYTATLRAFFSTLFRKGLLLQDPARELPLRQRSRLPQGILSESQAARLMEAPGITARWPRRGPLLWLRDRAVLETLYGAGIRMGECIRLDVADADLNQRLVLVRNGKGRKDRIVPLPRRAVLALDVYLRQSRPRLVQDPREQALFLSISGTRLLGTGLRELLLRHARAAGICQTVKLHGLRHSYATHLLRRGADVRHIQELLGHAGLESTEVYTRVEPRDLRKAILRAHPRERARARG